MDSQAAIKAPESIAITSKMVKIANLAEQFTVILILVSGHTDIEGNEQAN